jgi:hypothetical protein
MYFKKQLSEKLTTDLNGSLTKRIFQNKSGLKHFLPKKI